MSTITQLKKRKKFFKYKNLVKALKKCPQKKGICTKVLIMTPKKPSSAKRKVMRVRLSSKKFIFAYIPGEGVQTLRAYSRVLVQGGIIPDLPGVHYSIIRGKFDLNFLAFRRQGRSKYGMKAFFRARKKDRRNAFTSITEKKNQQILLYQKNFFIKRLIFMKFLKRKKPILNMFFLKKRIKDDLFFYPGSSQPWLFHFFIFKIKKPKRVSDF